MIIHTEFQYSLKYPIKDMGDLIPLTFDSTESEQSIVFLFPHEQLLTLADDIQNMLEDKFGDVIDG